MVIFCLLILWRKFYIEWCSLILILVVGLFKISNLGLCISVWVIIKWCFILFDSVCVCLFFFLNKFSCFRYFLVCLCVSFLGIL